MTQSLLNGLLDESEVKPYSVSEMNALVRGDLERMYSSVWIEGEVTSFTAHTNGHWYFNLKDDKAQIKAACFKNTNIRLRYRPANGDKIRVRGKLSLYELQGAYQVIADSLQPAGEGEMRRAFEQIEARLRAEGLFAPELKRPIPKMPHRVGVITSATGAAFHDVVRVILQRSSTVNILLIPAMVQGEGAAADIRRAIGIANEYSSAAPPDKKIDVLIVGRGGGSQEDLWSFNDEDLARAIRASEIPVISAVGHEIDHTISDLVADVRAATPSNAAEMVASSESEIRKSIGDAERIMIASIETRLIGFRSRYVRATSSPALACFPDFVARLKEGIFTSVGSMKTSLAALLLKSERRFEAYKHALSADRLRLGIANRRKEVSVFDSAQRTLAAGIVGAKQEQLGVAVAALEALSPLKVLSRGYSITQNAAGVVVKKARDVSSGDNISIKVSDGRIDATVNGVTEVQK